MLTPRFLTSGSRTLSNSTIGQLVGLCCWAFMTHALRAARAKARLRSKQPPFFWIWRVGAADFLPRGRNWVSVYSVTDFGSDLAADARDAAGSRLLSDLPAYDFSQIEAQQAFRHRSI